MIEATVNLKKGGALIVVSESWPDLMAALKGYEIIGINAHVVGTAEIRQGKRHAANAEKCICCGEPVPEGRQICPACETQTKGGSRK